MLDTMLGMGRDAGRDAAFDERLAEGRGTVGPISEQGFGGRQVLDHCGGGLVIIGLPFAQMQQSRAPLVVTDHLQLCSQSASAASNTSG